VKRIFFLSTDAVGVDLKDIIAIYFFRFFPEVHPMDARHFGKSFF